MTLGRVVGRRIRDVLVITIAPVFRLCGALVARSSFLRACRYSALDRQVLATVANGMTFVVNTADQVIARDMVVHGTFDLIKAKKALTIAGCQGSDTVFVDVGANIGSICLPLVQMDRIRTAIAIEPDPTNVTLLRANIVLNRLDERVTVHHTAVGAFQDERLTFELSNDNFGDHRISTTTSAGRYGEDQRRTIDVPSTTLDSLLDAFHDRKLFIWIDTQGYEGFILKGAECILQSAPPLVIEFWPYGMARAGSYAALKAALLNGRYRTWYDLSEDAPVGRHLDEAALDAVYAALAEEGDFTDLLLLADGPA